MPGLHGYVENHTTDPRTARFAVSAFFFADLAALPKAFESPAGQMTLNVAGRFSDGEQLRT